MRSVDNPISRPVCAIFDANSKAMKLGERSWIDMTIG